MSIYERIHLLKLAIEASHSKSDWNQRNVSPDSSKEMGWGPCEITATNRETKQTEDIGKLFDSGNLFLVLAMRTHIESLIEEIERLHSERLK